MKILTKILVFAVVFIALSCSKPMEAPSPEPSEHQKEMDQLIKSYGGVVLSATEHGYLRGQRYELLKSIGQDSSGDELTVVTNDIAKQFNIKP